MLKMGHLSSQVSNAGLLPTIESAQFFGNRLKQRSVAKALERRRLDISLLIEIVLVAITAILAIEALNSSFLSGAAWFVAPGILVAAAIIPTVVKRRKFADIGFNIKQIRNSLMVLGRTCMVVFPATFFGCWLLKSYGLDLPLRPMLPGGQSWACWLFYQFMYVAVAEEVFFRGYVQGNILKLTGTVKLGQYGLQQSSTLQPVRRSVCEVGSFGNGAWISITLSAACFAAAHIIVQGQIISVLTFLPGLILGWLFIRTRSLLAPILFHGLANICYFLMVSVIA
jgi:membrane protease YdiL (CAAX protease family)